MELKFEVWEGIEVWDEGKMKEKKLMDERNSNGAFPFSRCSVIALSPFIKTMEKRKRPGREEGGHANNRRHRQHGSGDQCGVGGTKNANR
jgi:hypothetical protein